MSLAHQIAPAASVDRVEHTPPAGVRWHPFADIFPWIEGPAFEELKADIAKNGVLEPIVFLDGAILDGRNRYMAARDLGIEYPRVEYRGSDPLAFVIAKNLARRHLTDKQRADAAAKIAKLPKGANQHTPIDGPSIAEAAAAMSVPVKAVERAKAVQERAIPEVKAKYDSGEIAPSVAADIASLPAERQAEVISSPNPSAAVKRMRQSVPPTDAEFAALMKAWNRAGDDARARFLAEINSHPQPTSSPEADKAASAPPPAGAAAPHDETEAI